MDEAAIRKLSCGTAGEPVPQVDAADIKAVWEVGQDVGRRHPEGGVAIGMDVYKAYCKPGADVFAILYRANMMAILQHVAPALIDPLMQGKLDAMFAATADIPMEWVGEGVWNGLPFDADDFVRRVREA